MIVFLWIFQVLFLDSFYREIKTVQIKSCARSVENNVDNKNLSTLANAIAEKNDIEIYVYNTSNNFFTRKYSSRETNSISEISEQAHRIYQYYERAESEGGVYTYFGNSKEDSNVSESDFGNGSEYSGQAPAMDRERAENFTYASIVDASDGNQYFIVVNAIITPVSSIVSTLRYQLAIVSVILIILGVLVAFFASKKISKPITETTKNAKLLAQKNYDVDFNSTGYLEVEELNETLNYAEKELKKVDDLQKELIANISHDLRTPLTMITGYGEIMRDLPGENTPENIQVIVDEAKRLNALVSDLMDISKIQAGVTPFNPEVISITTLIENIFTRYSKLKENGGYKLKFEYTENISVFADQIKMEQVIYNLINNAINYSGEKKEVIVRQRKEDDKVRIEVIDHGQGISRENLENIWDRYYKVDKEHRSSVVGTGLGLSIVKGVLDMHSARYGVISQEGYGSNFWFMMDIYDDNKRASNFSKKDNKQKHDRKNR
ncbi:MAG: sensor histidine kinase [Acutalibacteraceae bacterium]